MESDATIDRDILNTQHIIDRLQEEKGGYLDDDDVGDARYGWEENEGEGDEGDEGDEEEKRRAEFDCGLVQGQRRLGRRQQQEQNLRDQALRRMSEIRARKQPAPLPSPDSARVKKKFKRLKKRIVSSSSEEET